MTTTKPREMSAIDQIRECQSRLAQLDQEEASIEAHLGVKEQELAEAEEAGNFQLAAALSSEVSYLKGQGNRSKRQRIERELEVTERAYYAAIAAELESQAATLDNKVPDQRAKEDEALSRLEEVSGCQWMPGIRHTRPIRLLLGREGELAAVQVPLSQQMANDANGRRKLASRLRGANPGHSELSVRTQNRDLVRDALKLIPMH